MATRRKRLRRCRVEDEVFEELCVCLSEEVCLLVFQCLRRSDVFRAAPVCRMFRTASECPKLFSSLDLNLVGRSRTSSGRLSRVRCLHRFVELSLRFLEQPRFREYISICIHRRLGAESSWEIVCSLVRACGLVPRWNLISNLWGGSLLPLVSQSFTFSLLWQGVFLFPCEIEVRSK
jgi:hypothetical protein